MPYLLLVIGILIGLYALYRFFINADLAQVKAFFLLAMVVVLCAALFTLAVSGRLPAALAIMTAMAPLAAGWWKARKDEAEDIIDPPYEANIATREEAYDILGLEDGASESEIKAAYKKLMQKVHPDHEGSEWMAEKLNQARDILLKDD